MKLLKKEDAMKILAIIAITLATIAGGILIRHDLGFGGEWIFPMLAVIYFCLSYEIADEDEEDR